MKLATIVKEVDRLKVALEALRPLDRTRMNRLQQKLKLDWNYHSNNMEGNTLTESETRTFLLTGITAKGKPFRDYLEMKGHNDALTKLFQIVSGDLQITEGLVKDFHRMILVEPYQDKQAEIQPGEWKKRPNYLYSPTGERIDFSPPEDVPKEMNILINWLNNHLSPPKRKRHKYDLHPLLIAASFHQQFINIHPFGDGNGRLARILTNLILMLTDFVPIIIRTDERDGYYAAINASTLTDVSPTAIYFGERLIEGLQTTLKVAKKEDISFPDAVEQSLKNLNDQLDP